MKGLKLNEFIENFYKNFYFRSRKKLNENLKTLQTKQNSCGQQTDAPTHRNWRILVNFPTSFFVIMDIYIL